MDTPCCAGRTRNPSTTGDDRGDGGAVECEAEGVTPEAAHAPCAVDTMGL